ncbi:MAG: HAD family hydrolase [Clostridia bacterium]|nr:HAD family hydrolase [Clostridia bacterium]MBR7160800.1 HAD family hydrolase [Clostridia bacterium]
MKIKNVFFDLDGTLLPMDQEAFTKLYFKNLAKRLAPFGYDPEKLISAIWAGTASMIKNDGSVSNEDAFWQTFTVLFPEKGRNDEPIFEDFYKTEFLNAKAACGYTENASKIVSFLKEKGVNLILASNPIFPMIAQKNRITWAGVNPDDFSYITSYENSRFCKPNPAYYLEILEKNGLKAEQCLMIGNDAIEDAAAEKAGMKVFLLTDCLLNKDGRDISVYKNGNYNDLENYLKSLFE